MKFLYALLYIAALGILSHFIGQALPRSWFSAERFPYCAAEWENGGKVYEKLGIKHWKVVTWVIIFFLACDGLLTAAAMLRYTDRQNNPEPKNVAEAFLDDTYDDDWMEHHWPNMVVTKDAE